MKGTIILFFVFLSFSLFSQNSWLFDDYENRESDWEYTFDVKQLGNDKLISVTRNLGPLFHVLRIHDLRTGKVLKTKKYYRDNTGLYSIFVNEKSQCIYIFGKGTFIKDSIRQGFFIVTKWDFDLNRIGQKIYNLPKKQIIAYLYGNRFDNEYVFVGDSKTYGSEPITPMLFISVDDDGEVKLMKNLEIQGGVRNIVKKIDGSGYIGIGLGTYSFDNSLNVEWESFDIFDNAGGGISWYGDIYDDSTYIMGISYSDAYNEGVRLAKINSDLTIREQNIFKEFKRYGTLAQKGFDYYYKDALYLSAMDYFDKTYFDILKYDSDLNLLWRKHIRLNNRDTYYMLSIEATSDGGAIVCGNKQRNNIEGKRDSSRAFMLKIDGDGSVVSNDITDKSGWEITVFPNPSQGDFKIEINGNAQKTELQLFDIQGRKVKAFNNLKPRMNHINMYDLLQGMYIWKLEKDGGIIGNGKWIKK